MTKNRALKRLAQIIEEHMDKMGLTEEEKDARVNAFAADVDKLKDVKAREKQ